MNSALNYAYAATLANITRALVGLGLDPAIGYLRAPKQGRLSLSYDAIELLRPKIDACVFNWVKGRRFDRRDFVELPSGREAAIRHLGAKLWPRPYRAFDIAAIGLSSASADRGA